MGQTLALLTGLDVVSGGEKVGWNSGDQIGSSGMGIVGFRIGGFQIEDLVELVGFPLLEVLMKIFVGLLDRLYDETRGGEVH